MSRHRLGFWATAYAFLVVLAFSTAPSPLYARYAVRDGFSSFVITLIYAAYAVGVMASLFLVSHRSDVHGRRPHLLAGLALAVLSDLLFLVWPALPGLFVARVVCGLSVGVTVSTATAAIREHHQARSTDSTSIVAALTASLVNAAGLGIGALAGGVLAQYLGRPLTTPYWVLLGALLLAVVLIALSPETRRRQPGIPYRPQRLSVPQGAHREFYAALLGVFLAFGVAGMFIGLAGTFLIVVLHDTSLALSGVTVFVVFAAAVLVQLISARWVPRLQLTVGVALMIPGFALLVAAAWLNRPSLTLFLLGGAVLGGGIAGLFKGTLGDVVVISPPQVLGETLAAYYLAGYVGLTIPAVALGIALQFVSTRVALLIFAAVIVGGIISAAPVLLRRRADQEAL